MSSSSKASSAMSRRGASTAAIALTVLAVVSSPLAADDGGGFFVGGSVGRNSGTTNGTVWTATGYHLAGIGGGARTWRVFGGYRWPNFALEGGYRDLGTQSAASMGSSLQFRYTGLDFLAVGLWPAGRFDLFCKAGVLDYRKEEREGAWQKAMRNRTPLVGAGIAVRFSGFSVRVEWERSGLGDPMNENADFASVLSLGFVVSF